MAPSVAAEALVPALVGALPAACGELFGGTATPATAAATPGGDGWIAHAPLTGSATGRLVVWIDAASAAACAQRTAADAPVGDDTVVAALSKLTERLARVIEGVNDGGAVAIGAPVVAKAATPDGLTVTSIAFDDGTSATFGLGVDLAPSVLAGLGEPLTDSRLEAVLEVDLPLVVRFGRALMPLRNVADLSPGSVVDMGRSPDEPVELLVGERLVARGEVVIVGGNYGVRITEITTGRRITDREPRIQA